MPFQYDAKFVDRVVECQSGDLTKTTKGRYLLKIKLNNEFTDTLTVIMMNPSLADEYHSDSTVNQMISFIFRMNQSEISLVKEVGTINIVNLFPVNQSESDGLQKVLDDVNEQGQYRFMQHKNRKVVDAALTESESVLLAWGDVPPKVKATSHKEEVAAIVELLSRHNLKNSVYLLKFKGYDQVLTNKKRPRHPARKTLQGFVKVIDMHVKNKNLNLLI